jgi:hypothetical protein
MASFREIDIPSFLDTSAHDLTKDLFAPLLSRAVRYDRGVGFFSSGWLRINAKGMGAFAQNSGRARWVTSPILDENDWEALRIGDTARTDSILREALALNIHDLAQQIDRNTLSALAWLIADEILTFKLALPRNKLEQGDFHDKFGVFTDANGDQVSFNGSYNDSIQGTRNYESIKVFCSWEASFKQFTQADGERFERLWNNFDPNVRVFDLPEAAREQILQLRVGDRPYPKPEWLGKRLRDADIHYRPARPNVPGTLVLRDYQLGAIDAWFEHECRGLLEMATGTGKTITALAASARLYERENHLAVVIAVPYQHLVDQWNDEARAFGYAPVLAYQSKSRWLNDLNHQIMDFNAGYRRFVSVIVTHDTFASPDFQRSLARLQGPALLIADEAHHLGAEQRRQAYPENIPFRLALSATPDRWFDDIGTLALREFFGETVFSFTLEQAIGLSLTPYYYHPHRVALTDDEMERYAELSAKIARLAHRDDSDAQEALRMLLIKRADLLNNAANKLPTLLSLVNHADDVEYTLFYCAPGHIDAVLRSLGIEKGVRVKNYTVYNCHHSGSAHHGFSVPGSQSSHNQV